ncbi:hypothetical protein COT98_03520, partial [Candidatus Falkowbacteria bacterium CG10_big_fil_rev_8_21_14_0_10_39_9]
MTLSVFATDSVLLGMLWKSWNGYVYAFTAGFILWLVALFGPAVLWWSIVQARRFLARGGMFGGLLQWLEAIDAEGRLERLAFKKRKRLKAKNAPWWRLLQGLSTSYLLWAWLRHDLANIFVFLPRPVPIFGLVGILSVLNFGMVRIFRDGGGEISWS